MKDGMTEFAEFVEDRQRALQRSAWLLTGDWALAEDLVQTALSRVWPRWHRITRRDDPEIYVRKVILNTWLTWRGVNGMASRPPSICLSRRRPATWRPR